VTRDAATRDRLITAASRLFGKEGYRRVTVREICREAKANVAAVNYHFGDKLGLYREVVDQAIAVIRSGAAAAREGGAGLPAEDRLRHYVHAWLTQLLGGADTHAWIHGIMSHEMSEPTPQAPRIGREAIRPRIEYLSAIIAEILACPVTDPRVRRGTMAVQSHCLWYGRLPRIQAFARAAFPDWPNELADGLAPLADYIAEFSLAGIRLRTPTVGG